MGQGQSPLNENWACATAMVTCTAMKFVDLTPMRAVGVLPEGFLSGCSMLEGVDLTPLINLRKVRSYFLSS